MVPSDFDNVASFGEDDARAKAFKHPMAVLFHVGFRALALLVYVFCTWLTSSFVMSFLLILLFLSLDFWTVKNVTGRLLVGYRWWNIVDEDGRTQWHYESRKGTVNPHTPLEIRVFWSALVLGPVFWTFFALIALFTFKWSWLIIPLLGLAMNGANLLGYLRCKWSSGQELTGYLSKQWFGWMLRRSMEPTATTNNI